MQFICKVIGINVLSYSELLTMVRGRIDENECSKKIHFHSYPGKALLHSSNGVFSSISANLKIFIKP